LHGSYRMKKIIRRNVEVSQEFKNLHPLLQKIYAARDVNSLQEIDYSFPNLLAYEKLKGLDEALVVLWEALIQNQRILIVGDFDADGATSTVLALEALKLFGFQNVDYLIPNRFEFGYGLSPEVVEFARSKNPNLIITVDNGIASHVGVLKAKELGIKVLITDHHLQADLTPEAVAIVNPNQKGDEFLSKNLAGVGVAFYLMLALRAYLSERNWFEEKGMAKPNMAQFLDLVALGTVADVVTLDYNNRILVAQGIARIHAGKCRLGIKTLLNIGKRDWRTCTASDLAYVVAPRLNAAGRLDNMAEGVECLLSQSWEQVTAITKQLDAFNLERRVIEASMHGEALSVLDKLELSADLPLGLCIFEESWHQGVIGILASRIKDRLQRPVIAFAAVNDDELKGSARSIRNVHIRDLLDEINKYHPGLIIRFGGHAMAAGLTLKRSNFTAFQEVFADLVNERLANVDLSHTLYTDGELTLTDFSCELVKLLQQAGPWGQGFPEPLFDGVFNVKSQRLVGEKHLKLNLTIPGTEREIDAIYFNIDPKLWPNRECKKAQVVYRLDINEYNGLARLQLVVEHLEPKEF